MNFFEKLFENREDKKFRLEKEEGFKKFLKIIEGHNGEKLYFIRNNYYGEEKIIELNVTDESFDFEDSFRPVYVTVFSFENGSLQIEDGINITYNDFVNNTRLIDIEEERQKSIEKEEKIKKLICEYVRGIDAGLYYNKRRSPTDKDYLMTISQLPLPKGRCILAVI